MDGKIIFGSKGGLLEGIWNIIFKILGRISLHIRYRPKWRKMNRHNDTRIKNVNGIDNLRKIKVGNYTYGPLDCRIGGGGNSYIKIGNYCGIAEGVKFICGFGHNIKKFCHHPIIYYGVLKNVLKFSEREKNRLFSLEGENGGDGKGPIIIDDDVRIGTGAIILSGVHIHQGCVIGAGSVVTKDIPPYAIACGNPAKVVKYRFSDDIIEELLKINYGSIPIEKFWDIYEDTINENFNAKDLLKKINI